jgi:NAD(P)-dependent dehydrogenase (short-subunit alcohol dehydrogenase family)
MDAARVNWFSNVFFVKHMAAAIGSNGSIIIVSSLASTHPIAPMFTYAGAKAATDSMIRYAAFEYGPRQIRINSILPGPVLTELGTEHHSTPGVPEAYNRNIPLDRMGTGEDMANAVLWLAGPAYITGAQLPINGGLHLSRFPYPDEFPGGLKSFGAVQPLFDRQKLAEQSPRN